MCGIAGYWMATADKLSLIDSLSHMRHRGPDETVHFVRDKVELGLGMTRLAIVDVENGHQPYLNETETVVAVFNGEIYNHKELRLDLELKGHRLESTADGEVIVHLYEEYGLAFLSKLEGMFAIALFDFDLMTLLLARDRFGEKPLFYRNLDGGISFASSTEAANAVTASDAGKLSETALSVASRLGNFISPYSVFKELFKVEPGGYVRFDQFGEERGFFWRPVGGKLGGGEKVTGSKKLKNLDSLLSSSVAQRLPDEVPFGVFLSGGIDSALVAKYAKDFAEKVPAFTVRFREPSLDESELAATTASALGLDLTVVDFDEDDVSRLWGTLGSWMDEPNFDSSIFPTKHLCDVAATEIRVALTGDGGDEMFGGYPKYFVMDVAYPLARLFPKESFQLLGKFLTPHAKSRLLEVKRAASLGPQKLSAEINTAYFYNHELPEKNREDFQAFLERIYSEGRLDQNWLDIDLRLYLEGILSKLDTAAMSSSLETRSPFLDSEIFEFARGLPKRDLYGLNKTKSILRELASRQLPTIVTKAPKRGFTPSRRSMINVAIKMGVDSRIGDGRSSAEQLLGLRIEKSEWLAMVNDLSGRMDRIVWPVLVLESWSSFRLNSPE